MTIYILQYIKECRKRESRKEFAPKNYKIFLYINISI